MALDDDSLARIRPYVSNLDRSVFAVSGLPEEVIAVLLAYYSRSRDDLRTNLARLLTEDQLGMHTADAEAPHGRAQDKARAFHEKWVVGYGHASVAEHAVVHLAVEDVSIVASKAIEDLRLGSFTEKSTRYVVFDTGSFHDLPELDPTAGSAYRSTCRELFATYLELFPIVEARLDELVPVDPAQKPKARANALRAHTCDLLRGLLPASTKTNLGLTANARALASLLTKMMSSPLHEVRALAMSMRDEARTVAPTLVRHVDHNPYRASLHHVVAAASPTLQAEPTHDAPMPVRVVRHDDDALERIALALLYDQQVEPHAVRRMDHLRHAPREQLTHLVRQALRDRGPFDAPPRAFEASSMLVELELDYGAYRDLQRHRMLAPFTQLLGCTLGAAVPAELDRVGVGDQVRRAHERAAQTWRLLQGDHPWEAQYAVPLAYRVRTLWALNLRELFYVVELRSGKQGHASYRRIAQALYRAACEVHPWLADTVRVDLHDYALARSG